MDFGFLKSSRSRASPSAAIPERKGAAIAAAVGIAGVVGVLVGVLAIAEGFRQTMIASARPDVAIVLRNSTNNEMNSGLTREETRIIRARTGIKNGPNGPLTSSELFVVINLLKRSTRTDANVPLRGVEPDAYASREHDPDRRGPQVEPGKNRIIVGVGAARAFVDLEMARTSRSARTYRMSWVFSVPVAVPKSPRIWTDAGAPARLPARGRLQSVYVKLASPASFTEFKDFLTTHPQVKTKQSKLGDSSRPIVHAQRLHRHHRRRRRPHGAGRAFGALNTMYGAVAARTREIATLRALGFGAMPVMVSVLAESVALALVGGVAGAGIAYLAFNGYRPRP